MKQPIDTTPANPNTGTFTDGAAPMDAQGRRYVIWPDGTKFYLRPDAGSPLYFQGSGGGMVHKPDSWNPKTGQWEKGGVDWSALGPWLGLAAIGGASAVAALSASAPAAVASQSVAAAGGASAAGAGAAGAAAGTAAGGVAAGTTAAATGGAVAAGSSLWGYVAPSIIGAGAQLGGAYLQSRSNSKAAELEAQGTKAALDWAKEQAALERGDLAPYRALGVQGISKLQELGGLTSPPGNPVPQAQNPNSIIPGQSFPASWMTGGKSLNDLAQLPPNWSPRPTIPMGTGGSPSTGAGGGMGGGGVLMRAPDGSQRTVPNSFVAEAQAKGCTLVTGPVQRTSLGGQ